MRRGTLLSTARFRWLATVSTHLAWSSCKHAGKASTASEGIVSVCSRGVMISMRLGRSEEMVVRSETR